MKKIYFLVSLSILLIGISCNSKKGNNNQSTTSLIDSLPADKPSLFYRGSLIFAPESNYLKDCVTKQDWWVVNEAEEDIEELYRKMTERPYQAVYAEIKGYLEPSPKEGFPSEYDQLLVITELIKLDDLDDDNNCTLTDNVN